MKVLVAIDEFEFVEPIIRQLTTQHWPAETEFVVVNVVEPLFVGSYMSVLPSPMIEEASRQLRERGKQLTGKMAEAIRTSLSTENVRERVEEGFPSETLLGIAETEKIDLFVVGSHGRHGLDRIVRGSVSGKVAGNAPCSTLVVHCNPGDSK